MEADLNALHDSHASIAQRLQTELHRHTTRIELIDHALKQAHADQREIRDCMKELMDRFLKHEIQEHENQRRTLSFIILTLLSATGGLIVLTVQSIVTITH